MQNSPSKARLFEPLTSENRQSVWKALTKTSELSYRQHRIYQHVSSARNSCSSAIQTDVSRTFPLHPLFSTPTSEGQLHLEEILTAYSEYDTEVGYCQGMNFIVGTLLKVLLDKETTFWAFVFIMYDKDWRSMFKTGTPKLALINDSLNRQLESHLLTLYLHFREENFDIACFSGVLMTIFSYKCEEKISLAMMDLFLVQGEQVLYTVVLKMLKVKRNILISMNHEELCVYCLGNMLKECFEEHHLDDLAEFSEDPEYFLL